jgi:ribosomal protein S18 acetylase RimI-like enzyme
MPKIALRPMSHSEFAAWTKSQTADYAEDKQRSLGISRDQAMALAERSFADLLPDGMATKGAFLYVAETPDKTPVGSLWFNVSEPHGETECFVFDIVVDTNHRRKGYARQMLKNLNSIARDLGATKIGLHVFGFNDAAIALYRSVGFEVTDMTMVRQVTT